MAARAAVRGARLGGFYCVHEDYSDVVRDVLDCVFSLSFSAGLISLAGGVRSIVG